MPYRLPSHAGRPAPCIWLRSGGRGPPGANFGGGWRRACPRAGGEIAPPGPAPGAQSPSRTSPPPRASGAAGIGEAGWSMARPRKPPPGCGPTGLKYAGGPIRGRSLPPECILGRSEPGGIIGGLGGTNGVPPGPAPGAQSPILCIPSAGGWPGSNFGGADCPAPIAPPGTPPSPNRGSPPPCMTFRPEAGAPPRPSFGGAGCPMPMAPPRNEEFWAG
jgi:hypothetical protein